MRKLLMILLTFSFLTACQKDDDDNQAPVETLPFDRTVLVYIAGENNLNRYISSELDELRKGSADTGHGALVVFVDGASSEQKPYIARIKNGEMLDMVTYETDEYACDPKFMTAVLKYVISRYPANEYGLVLWGHATGWMMQDSIAEARNMKRAYGYDTGNNSSSGAGKWINMHSLAQVINSAGIKLKYIFADCCQFQCVESAYELRNTADYIIGSPAEIPGEGAPYDKVTKGLFSLADDFYKTIVDRYFEQIASFSQDGWTSYNGQTPLSVIKTSELPQLAQATHHLLGSFLSSDSITPWKISNVMFYYGNYNKRNEDCMYDMNDIMIHYADAEDYATWKEAFDKAVIYKKFNKYWVSNGQVSVNTMSGFNSSNYGGMTMFVPQDRKNTWYYPYTSNGVSYEGYNASIHKTSWYHDAKLNDFGW